ncbi:GTPase [Muriicola sp.]|uniref:GTPase n=1 Tax=Muriicola sp. TaxID=2020856 RepID=UPI003C762F3E
MATDAIEKLIFIYNADTGLKNGLFDIAHKIFNPSTYECRLCELTFGTFREKRLWKNFRLEHTVQMEFLHKDEFLKTYASKFMPAYTFPIILEATAHDLEIFMTTKELKAMSDTQDLIAAINQKF